MLLGATKASVAHAESPAGLIGLLAAINTGLIGASNDVNPHLRWVNPHVGGVLEALSRESGRSGDAAELLEDAAREGVTPDDRCVAAAMRAR